MMRASTEVRAGEPIMLGDKPYTVAGAYKRLGTAQKHSRDIEGAKYALVHCPEKGVVWVVVQTPEKYAADHAGQVHRPHKRRDGELPV